MRRAGMARAQPDAATHRLHHFPGYDTLMLTAPHSRHRHDRQPSRISMAASLQGMPRLSRPMIRGCRHMCGSGVALPGAGAHQASLALVGASP